MMEGEIGWLIEEDIEQTLVEEMVRFVESGMGWGVEDIEQLVMDRTAWLVKGEMERLVKQRERIGWLTEGRMGLLRG